MNTYSLDSICIVSYDDNSIKQYRDTILRLIFQLNNYGLSPDSYTIELEKFKKNQTYIDKYRIQNSVFFIQYNRGLTFDIIKNKFNEVSNNDVKILLISKDKCLSTTKFINQNT